MVPFRTPVRADPPHPGCRPLAGWRSLPRCRPLSDVPRRLENTNAEFPLDICHRRTLESIHRGYILLTRDEATRPFRSTTLRSTRFFRTLAPLRSTTPRELRPFRNPVPVRSRSGCSASQNVFCRISMLCAFLHRAVPSCFPSRRFRSRPPHLISPPIPSPAASTTTVISQRLGHPVTPTPHSI